MLSIHRSADRGGFDFGWLKTRHSFSFGRYHDPRRVQFRALRVLNEDEVAPGRGFPEHPHEDMEIISYVLAGELAHRDSAGHQDTVRGGGAQYMSAGSGVEHSEFNPSRSAGVHFVQIWMLPASGGTRPRYESARIDARERAGRLTPIAVGVGSGRSEGEGAARADDAGGAGSGGVGPFRINARGDVSALVLMPGQGLEHALAAGRHAYVQVLRGRVVLNGEKLGAGDGAAVSPEGRGSVRLEVRAEDEEAEMLVFELE